MTEMREAEDLLSRVLPAAPNCPAPVALRAIVDAAREICTTSRIWRERDTISVISPDFEALCTVQDTEIVGFEDARLNGVLLTPMGFADLDARCPGWETTTDEGAARYITQVQPNSLTIVPRQAGLLSVRLTLQPSDQAELLPAFLLQRYPLDLASGALALILALPNTEYQNAELAAVHGLAFAKAISRIKWQATRGQQGRPVRTKANFF